MPDDPRAIARELHASDWVTLLKIGDDYAYVPDTHWCDLERLRFRKLVNAYRGHRGYKASRTPLGRAVATALREGGDA